MVLLMQGFFIISCEIPVLTASQRSVTAAWATPSPWSIGQIMKNKKVKVAFSSLKHKNLFLA